MPIKPSGPIPTQVMIVGDAPSYDDDQREELFTDGAGYQLTKMLHEAGISRSECFITSVARSPAPGGYVENWIAKAKKDRTSEHTNLKGKWVRSPIVSGSELLSREIEAIKPSLIITLGSLPLWGLTGLWGVNKWRGSMLRTDSGIRLVPTYHPSSVLRQWEQRAIAVNDLRRAARFRFHDYPPRTWNFIVRPSFSDVTRTLTTLLNEASTTELELSFDLETRAGHIACAGISWDINHAISIPFMCVESKEGYWTAWEEAQIIYLLYMLLCHSNVKVVGQNLLYDSQYTYRHWHFIPRVTQDTMISHHVAFAGLPKRLDFQASMYCDEYVYWKDDGKNWGKHMDEAELWSYNAEDCVRTQECAAVERTTIEKLGLKDQEAFQQSMFWPVLQTMNRGIKVDIKKRGDMALELMEELSKREAYFKYILGHSINPRSPKQMQQLFYHDFKLPIIKKRGTGKPTLDEDALNRLCVREPIIRPLVKAITEYRSLGVFLSTFVQAPLDTDGRMRCSYNICGTETYRLSSSENAFGSGTNFQNIPKGTTAKEAEDLSLPNIRKIFIPDAGYIFFDMDLDRADLQVVVWEADDANLKKALRMGVDMHCMNAVDIYRIKGIPVDELVESHPNYPDRRGQITEELRQRAKGGVHAVDYACKARTLAVALGCTVHEADKFIDDWFAAHPGIKRWHTRTEHELHSKRSVSNAFGFRRYYFDRIENLLPEALAWKPQSTVAITINKIWRNIYDHLPEVQVLLQVHDSLAGQFPKGFNTTRLAEHTQVTIPYEDPLIIPVGLKTSPISWGDCK